MLMSGWGMQRQQFGEQKHWMLVTLAAMLGQIGTPGGGFGLSYHFANGGNPTRRAAVLARCRAAWRAVPTRWKKSRSRGLLKRWKTPGRSINTTAWTGASRIFALSGGRRRQLYPSSGYQPLIRAWQKPELIVISNASGPPPRAMPISSCRRPPRLNATI
jgi:biotin/methionine sulfoxide reductase